MTPPVEDDDDYLDDPYSQPVVVPKRRVHAGFLTFVCSLPSLFAIGAAVSIAGIPLPNLESTYRARAQEALASKSFPSLKIASQRMLQFNPKSQEAQFWYALSADAFGDRATVDAIIAEIAPITGGGYPPAHFWLAERLLRQDSLTPAILSDVEKHLTSIGDNADLKQSVDRRLAQVLLKTGRLKEAKPHLESAMLSNCPDLRVIYAEALMAAQKPQEAQLELQTAIEDAERMTRAAGESIYARRTLADAYALQRNYPKAERVLLDAIALGPFERPGISLARLYSKWIADADAGLVPVGPNRLPVESAIDLVQKDPNKSMAVQGMLVFLLRYVGKLDESQAVLERLAEVNVDAAFDLARLYQQRGDSERARNLAGKTATQLLRMLEAQADSFALRDRAAGALTIAGDYEKACQLLMEGLARSKDRRYRAMLAGAYVAWWDAVAQGREPAPKERLEYLRKAIGYDPWNAAVIQRLSTMKGADAQASKSMLNELLARGDSPPAAVHWILGNSAWQQNDQAMARTHMEQAHELEKSNPLVLNNLAWYLAHSEPRDLQRASLLAEEAVKIAPLAVEIRDTRGRIRAKLGDWKGALADLQICLPYKKGDAEFHRVIATAFEIQQMGDLARHHRRLAEEAELRQNQKEENSKR